MTWLSSLAEATQPPAQLLVNGAATGWIPPPHSVSAPDLQTMCSLLAGHLKRLKGSSSSDLDMVPTPFLKSVVRYVLRSEGHGFDKVHDLLRPLAQLFLLSFESVRVAADREVAKVIPMYKKGPMLDPSSYRMLAVSGTMYTNCDNNCSISNSWHEACNKTLIEEKSATIIGMWRIRAL